jgi:hypothetical protein
MQRPQLAPYVGRDVTVDGFVSGHGDDHVNGTGHMVAIKGAQLVFGGKLSGDKMDHVWVRYPGDLEYVSNGSKVRFVARVYSYGRGEHALESARQVKVY